MPPVTTSSSRIKVIPGICPNDPNTLLLDNILGGGGNQYDYFVTWFRKTNPSDCHSYYNYGGCIDYPTGYTKKFQIKLNPTGDEISNDLSIEQFPGNVTIFTSNIPLTTVDNAIPLIKTTFELAFTSQVLCVIVDAYTLDVYCNVNFPYYNSLFFATHYINPLKDDWDIYSNMETCPGYFNNICGWNPVASNYGLFTYVTPPGPGIYMVEVTDKAGITSRGTVEIGLDSEFPCLIDVKNISCNGADDGELCAIDPEDGSGNLGYEWSVSTIINPPLTCYDETGAVIPCPSAPIIPANAQGCWEIEVLNSTCANNLVPIAPECYLQDGTLTPCPGSIVVNGCYIIIWRPRICPSGFTVISTDKCIKNLGPGTYCLAVTNAKGCKRTCCVTITEPDLLAINIINQIDPTCVGCNDPSKEFGQLLFEVTGGNTECNLKCDDFGPYQYSLDGSDYKYVDMDNRVLLTHLTVGMHKLKVKDCKCCYQILDFTILSAHLDIRF